MNNFTFEALWQRSRLTAGHILVPIAESYLTDLSEEEVAELQDEFGSPLTWAVATARSFGKNPIWRSRFSELNVIGLGSK